MNERNLLEHTERVVFTHSEDECRGAYCTIHFRSAHLMRSFPQHWRSDILLMERTCPHGIGHPDPDEQNINVFIESHGCDGCCQGAYDL